jgi:hypothetical protein
MAHDDLPGHAMGRGVAIPIGPNTWDALTEVHLENTSDGLRVVASSGIARLVFSPAEAHRFGVRLVELSHLAGHHHDEGPGVEG